MVQHRQPASRLPLGPTARRAHRPDPVEAIAWLRRAADKLATSSDPDLIRLEMALRAYEGSGGTISMDDALGLKAAGGGGPWWHAEARARRDRLLREVRSTCLADMDLGTAAEAIIATARQRQRGKAPAASRQAKLVDMALKCGPLPQKRQLRAILGNPPP